MANYLYNGIELPKLPETTEEKPNGFIIVSHATGEPVYYARYSSLEKEANVDGSVILISYDYVLRDGSWISGTGTAAGTIIWANYDVYYADDVEEVGGTLYLAASDPIPVNPAPTLDPTALLMGWQVGNRIRQRTKGATE